MDLVILLAILGGFLLFVLIVLLLIGALMGPAQVHHIHEEDDLQQIKDQIEREGELEAEEELMPYKPPRLDKPSTRKRL